MKVLSLNQMKSLKGAGVPMPGLSAPFVAEDPKTGKIWSLFTLQDIIDLLPKYIPDKKGGKPYHIDLTVDRNGYKFSIRRHEADCLVGTHFHDNILDAAYEILLYIYENNLQHE